MFHVLEIRPGERDVLRALELLLDKHDALRVRVGQRLEQDGADEAEDGGVGADAEGEDQQHHGGVQRGGAELAQGEAEGFAWEI